MPRARRASQVLYAGQDRFAAYELLGADTTCRWSSSPTRTCVENPTKPFDTGNAYSPIDFDSFTYETLNHYRYVITSVGGLEQPGAAELPRRSARTDSYILWERTGRLARGSPDAARGHRGGCAASTAPQPESRLFATPQVGRPGSSRIR